MWTEKDVARKAIPQEALQKLEATFGGELITPGHTGYDQARRVFNAMIDRFPALIARCAGVADVLAAVEFARTYQLDVAVRGGGHSVTGASVCDGGVVIDLAPMKGARVDPASHTVRAQAGLTWGELDRETQAFGLAVTGGRVSSTGISGLTLGSGSGWLERMFGFSVDNLLSADVVTADGRLVTASAAENEDLFWGIRGGGGNFGIVTEFEFRLHPVGPIVLGGILGFPAERATEVLTAYRDLIEQAPDELGGGAAFITAPPEPFVPEEIQGHQVLGIIVCYVGDPESGEEAIRPLRELGPGLDLVGPTPYTAVQRLVDGGNQPGFQNYWKAGFCSELSDEALETFVANAYEIKSPLTALLLFPLGGAVARVPDDATPLGHRSAKWNYHAIGMWVDPSEAETHMAWARTLDEAMRPYRDDGVYLNFTSDTGVDRVKASFGPEKYERLVALKDKYDPTNFFGLNQNIEPSGLGAAADSS